MNRHVLHAVDEGHQRLHGPVKSLTKKEKTIKKKDKVKDRGREIRRIRYGRNAGRGTVLFGPCC